MEAVHTSNPWTLEAGQDGRLGLEYKTSLVYKASLGPARAAYKMNE